MTKISLIILFLDFSVELSSFILSLAYFISQSILPDLSPTLLSNYSSQSSYTCSSRCLGPPFFGTVPRSSRGGRGVGTCLRACVCVGVHPRPLSAPLSRLDLARAPARGPSSAELGWKSISYWREGVRRFSPLSAPA